jgi:hypothetical protein
LQFKNQINLLKTLGFPTKNATEILAQAGGNKRLTQLRAGSIFLRNFCFLGPQLFVAVGTFGYVEDLVKA